MQLLAACIEVAKNIYVFHPIDLNSHLPLLQHLTTVHRALCPRDVAQQRACTHHKRERLKESVRG